ncbi:MAG: acyloxyacyl hydrolase [Bacteroidales bacterium]|jgi:hypothetical protein|nr:acyloxyacyl hydrolase [Bacteroidales bacterium]
MKQIFTLFLLSFAIMSLHSQQRNDVYISAFSHYGSVISTNSFLNGENRLNQSVKRFGDISLRCEIQTNGCRQWHSWYDYPSFGFGLYLIDFRDNGLLRTPIAAYTFLSFSYWHNKRLDLRGEFALGLAGNWDYFSENNVLNTAIGSPITCYFDYGFHLYCNITGQFKAGVGVSMTHFSNGGLRKPNKGINMIAPRFALKYNAFPQKKNDNSLSQNNVSKEQMPNVNKFNFVLTTFGGSYGHYYRAYNYGLADSIFRKSFFVCGISPSVIYNFNIKHGLGLGLDFAYFDMAGKSTEITNGEIVLRDEIKNQQRFNAALFLAYEYRIHHFTLTVEPCLYLYQYKSETENLITDVPVFYQRIGVRWQATNHFFCGLKLRAYNFSIAHFIEWNVGIRL